MIWKKLNNVIFFAALFIHRVHENEARSKIRLALPAPSQW